MPKKEQNNSSQRIKLQNELIKLIKTIDAEGLLFLIQQANVLRYNMEVDKINVEKSKIINEGLIMPKKNGKKSGTRIQIIPSEKKNFYIIEIDAIRKFFSIEDFKGIVKVAQSDGEKIEKAGRLLNWLDRERRDILIDCKISNKQDPRLHELIEVLKNRYKVNKQ